MAINSINATAVFNSSPNPYMMEIYKEIYFYFDKIHFENKQSFQDKCIMTVVIGIQI